MDTECQASRMVALKAGERVVSHSDRLHHRIACKQYKALKQRKKRNLKSKGLTELEKAFKENPSNIWDAINKLQMTSNSTPCEPNA